MPKLPQISSTKRVGLLVNANGPAEAFDSGASRGTGNLGAGLLQASDNLASTAAGVKAAADLKQFKTEQLRMATIEAQDRRKEQDDISASSEAFIQWELGNVKYFRDNRTNPNAEDTLNTLNTSISDVSKGLSQGASKLFEQRANSKIPGYFQDATVAETKLFLEKQKLANENDRTFIAQLYREQFDLNPDSAGEYVKGAIEETSILLDQQWKNEPGMATRQKQNLVASMVLTASELDPALADEILNEFDILDAETRKTLKGVIKTKAASINQTNVAAFEDEGRAIFEDAKQGLDGYPTPITNVRPLFRYVAVYGPDGGQRRFNEDVQKIEIYNSALGIVDPLKGLNSTEITKARNDYNIKIQSLKGDMSPEAVSFKRTKEIVDPILDQLDKELEDPWSYISRFNDGVKHRNRRIVELSKVDPESEEGFFAAKDIEALRIANIQDQKRLQGRPDKNLPEEERRQYHHNDPGQLRIMSKADAEETTADINSADPNQKAAQLNAFEERWRIGRNSIEANKNLRVAFDNIMKLPSEANKLDSSLEGGFILNSDLNKNRFLNAVANQNDGDTKFDERRKLVEKEIENLSSDSPLNNFRKMMVIAEDDTTGAKMEKFISDWATAGFQGNDRKDPKEAVRLAQEAFISDNFIFFNNDGNDYMIPKYTVEGVKRDDVEALEIARGLEYTIDTFPLDRIDPAKLPGAFTGDRKRVIDEGIRKEISFVLNPDQQTLSLYLQGDTFFEHLLDKETGKPLVATFDFWELEEAEVRYMGTAGKEVVDKVPRRKYILTTE